MRGTPFQRILENDYADGKLGRFHIFSGGKAKDVMESNKSMPNFSTLHFLVD